MNGWFVAFLGATAGAVQAGLLGRTVRRGIHPLGLLVRIGLVAAVLVFAARAGQLLPGAAAWLAGFMFAAVIVQRRLR